MKKFLSLLLALVMTMSLVTISAGATEYKDLTDKDELGPQYQEAVAVLNKIGVITGYDDGSFRPDVELTRGAAAKIIVSLLIGPEAANNLPNNSAPYPDVPANHTFAGVISFCKTAGIINGYGDGTFKPANDLTGYAFAKMLLSALGYDNTIEGFVDTGWTMNVLNIGQEAGLFDRLDFKGSDAVSRKDAALLALNTLKATVVEYNNPQTITISGADAVVNVTGGQTRSYKISNQDFAKNILSQRRNANTTQGGDWWTVEFAEEHFVDLRLTSDKYSPIDDDFGRPSAEWSYKKLSIGKFPLVPDYEYTTQVIHNVDTTTDGAKTRALGLSGFDIKKDVNGTTRYASLWVNGVEYKFGQNQTYTWGDQTIKLDSTAAIADFTDNGTLVEVYVDNNGADFITDVVVVRTQLMEVRRVGSDYVSLDILDDHSDANGKNQYGYNFIPVDEKVNNVEAQDEYYTFLSGLKVGDRVAVVPVAVDHDPKSYDVGEAYSPETVTGALSGVETYGAQTEDRNVINLTVGGTKYNVALWNQEMVDIESSTIKVTKKDVTLTLDKYGNALRADDVGATSNWMVIGNYRQGLVNGIVVTYANGWDIKGNEISLNVGYQHDSTGSGTDWYERNFPVGSLVYYTNSVNSNTAEWELLKNGIFAVSDTAANSTEPYTIGASNSRLYLDPELNSTANTKTPWSDIPEGAQLPFYKNDVPFIYITLDKDNEVDSIEIKKNPQKVTNGEILGDKSFEAIWGTGLARAEAALTLDKTTKQVKLDDDTSGVEAVVFKMASSAVSINNMLYISNYHGSITRDSKGTMIQGYEVAMLGEGGKLIETGKIIYSDRTDLKIGDFARYTPATHDEFEDFYNLRVYGRTSKESVSILDSYVAKTGVDNAFVGVNNRMVYMDNAKDYNIEKFNSKADTSLAAEFFNGTQDSVDNLVNIRGAQWLDLSSYAQDVESPSELKDAYKNLVNSAHTTANWHRDIALTILFNDNPDSDEFRQVYLVVVRSVSKDDVANTSAGTTDPTPSTGAVKYASGVSAAVNGEIGASKVTVDENGKAVAQFQLTAPDWAYTGNPADAQGTATWGEVTYRIVRDDNQTETVKKSLLVVSNVFDGDECLAAVSNGSKVFQGSVTLTTDNIFNPDRPNQDWLKGHSATVEITKVDWKCAKVEYTLNGEAVTLTGSTTNLPVGSEANISVTAIPGATGSTTGKWTLSGAAAAAGTSGTFANNLNATGTIADVTAAGGAKVVVGIVSDQDLPVTVTVNSDIQGAKTMSTYITGSAESRTLTITPNTADYTLSDGKALAQLTVTLSGAPSIATVSGYNVELTLPDGKQDYTLTATESAHTFSFYVTKSFELTKDMVKVTPEEYAVKATSASKGTPVDGKTPIVVETSLGAAALKLGTKDVTVVDLDNNAITDVSASGAPDGKVTVLVPTAKVDAGVKITICASNAVTVNSLSRADNGIARFAAVTASDLPTWNNSALVIFVDVPAGSGSITTEVMSWEQAKEKLLAPADPGDGDDGEGENPDDQTQELTVTVSASGWTAAGKVTVNSGTAAIDLTNNSADGEKYKVTYKVDSGSDTESGELTLANNKITLKISNIAESATTVTISAVTKVESQSAPSGDDVV